MKKDILSVINIDEATFYAIAERGWNECSEAQKDFTAFNPIYTKDYITSELKALQAAKDLPNQEARLAVQTRMRAILEDKAFTCNNLVQNLYTIIARFPESEVESLSGSSRCSVRASGS